MSNQMRPPIRPRLPPWSNSGMMKSSGITINWITSLDAPSFWDTINCTRQTKKSVYLRSKRDGVPDPNDYHRPGVNTQLWQAFGQYFDRNVAAWFWGHEHNLGIYQDLYRPADWPPPSGQPNDVWQTLRKGRCVGHSAIPVATTEQPYQANYPVPLLP